MCINLKLNTKEELMNDHDRLIAMHTDIKWIKKTLTDHLRKHWWFATVVITVLVGVILVGKFLS